MPKNPAYQSMLARSKRSKDTVANAWANGQPAKGSNMHTDGQTLYSYNHVVGVTLSNGDKIAFDCHYSVTTAKQCGPAKVIADNVVPCASCESRSYTRSANLPERPTERELVAYVASSLA